MPNKEHVTEGMSDEWQHGARAGSWIFEENLRPFVIHASILSGYKFDDSDWAAIHHGVSSTDDDAGKWFDYPLGTLKVEIARSDPRAGTGIVALRIDLTGSDLFRRGQLEMLVRLMQESSQLV